MAFDAGTILGHLTLDQSGFTSGILQAQGMTQLLGSTISGALVHPILAAVMATKELATWTAAFVKGAVTGAADAADSIGKLSQATGTSTEFLSGLSYAADLADVGFEQLKMGIGQMINALADAAKGTGPAAEAFARLGVSATDGAGNLRGAEDVFLDVAEALKNVGNATERAALVQDLFGRGSLRLVPLLAQGRAGLQAMFQAAKDTGNIFDAEAAAGANVFNDAITRAKAVWTGLKNAVGVPIFEALGKAFEDLGAILGPYLTPVIEAYRAAWEELAPQLGDIVRQVGSSLLPYLKALPGILADTVPFMRMILDLALQLAKVLEPIVAGLTAYVSLSSRIFGGAARLAGYGAPAGDRTVAAPAVTVQVSPEDSARRVAEKVAPAIVRGVGGVQRRVEGSARRWMDLADFEAGLATR
jgi:hypothetical protein